MTTPAAAPAMASFNAAAPPGFMQSPMMAPMSTMFSMIGDAGKQQAGTTPPATILGQQPFDATMGALTQRTQKTAFGQ